MIDDLYLEYINRQNESIIETEIKYVRKNEGNTFDYFRL